MIPLKTQHIKSDYPLEDTGISVKNLLELIKDHEYYDLLFDQLNIIDIYDDFIEIRGAKTLFDHLINLKSNFLKTDCDIDIKNVVLFEDVDQYEEDQIDNNIEIENQVIPLKLRFNDIAEYSAINKNKVVFAHNAKSVFYKKLFNINNYAKELEKNNIREVIIKNLEFLKTIDKNEKLTNRYRFVHDITRNIYYLRTVVSKKYRNYDINISAFIGLISLHQKQIETKKRYSLMSCEYNESKIKIYFVESGCRSIEKVGDIKNTIFISNNELIEGPLIFSLGCSIICSDQNKNKQILFFERNNISVLMFRITHAASPTKAIEKILSITSFDEVHDEIFEDMKYLSKINDIDEIRDLVKSKVKKATRFNDRIYKDDIINTLSEKVNNIYEIVILFAKLKGICSEDYRNADFIYSTLSDELYKCIDRMKNKEK